jgi:hypothetical protein
MRWVFSGEAVTEESLGRSPTNSAPQEEHSAESAFQSGPEKRHVVHVLSRAFSARTLLILVPRASPQAFLSHGFRLRKLDPLCSTVATGFVGRVAAVIADQFPSTKSDKPYRDERVLSNLTQQ